MAPKKKAPAKPKIKQLYNKETLELALEEMTNGMSAYKASKKYGIPKSTLKDKKNKKYSGDQCGAYSVLTLEEENLIVSWIHYLGDAGFPVSKDQLLETVATLVKNLNRPNPFKNGIPGYQWYQNFLRRHPDTSLRMSQNLTKSRTAVTEKQIRDWFEKVKKYFEENEIMDVLQDGSRIFNLDETAFFLCPQEKQVLVKKGSKAVYSRVANDEKECLTVLANVSADGNVAPPMVLFPYSRLPKHLPVTMPSGWGIGHTESGWMNHEAFYEYATNVFDKWLSKNKIKRPVVLFVDGHTSHISLALSEFCKEYGIILVALVPNSTHILQPLDVAVYRPVKGTWRKIVHKFKINHNYQQIKRSDFSPLVKEWFDVCLKETIIQSAFKCTGLFPFTPDGVNYGKLKKGKNEYSTSKDSVIINKQVDLFTGNFKETIKKKLSSEALQKFQTNPGTSWMGEARYKKLFDFWQLNCNNNLEKTPPEKDKPDTQKTPPFQQNFEDIHHLNEFGDQDESDTSILDDSDVLGDTTLINNLDSDFSIFNLKEDGALELETSTEDSHRFNNNNTIKVLRIDMLNPTDSLDVIENIYATSNLDPVENLNNLSPVADLNCVKNVNPENHNPVADLSFVQNVSHSKGPSSSQNFKSVENFNYVFKTPPESANIENSKNHNNEDNASEYLVTPPKFPTPFKNAFFFPKKQNSTSKKRVTKKITPVVAISDEFIEYQRRKDLEKETKEQKKKENIEKRKLKAIEKNENKTKKVKSVPVVKLKNLEDSTEKQIESTSMEVNTPKMVAEKRMEKTDNHEMLNTAENITNSFTKGDYVIFKYEQKYFPGLIEDSKSKSYYIKAMEKSGSHWKWPHREDVIWYDLDEIISKIEPPQPINKRGLFTVPEIDEMDNSK